MIVKRKGGHIGHDYGTDQNCIDEIIHDYIFTVNKNISLYDFCIFTFTMERKKIG